jgi:hypothetical protein
MWKAPGHDFETQRALDLPADLWNGPPPTTQSRQLRSVQSVQSRSLANTLEEPWRSLVYAAQRKGDFIPIFGVVGTVALLIRSSESRTYFIIQNTSAANQLFIGVGYPPVNNGVSVTGLILAANGGNYEPSVIPQGDIWVLGSAANTGFVMHVAQG